MKKTLLLVLFIFSFSSESLDTPSINYLIEKKQDSYFVEVAFQAADTEKTLLSLPLKWANAHSAHKGVHNLTVLSPDTTLIRDEDKVHIIHKPLANIVLRYQLMPVAESTLDPTQVGYTLPIFNDSYIHWIGITSLVSPYLQENTSKNISVTLATKGFDESFPFYSSLAMKEGKYQFFGAQADFLSSIFVAGDYRIKKSTTKYGKVSLAIRGQWNFADEALYQSLTDIYTYQREYWDEPDFSDDLWVALTPLDNHENPYVVQSNGIALHKSFTSFFTRNLKQENINNLFAHEGFHHWLPKQFGKLAGEPQSLSWFSEGFTNYLTNELLLLRGLIVHEQHQLVLEKAYRTVNDNAFKHLSNSQQARMFFSDSLIPDVIYARGMVLAHMWDLDIKRVSDDRLSLRDMLLSLKKKQQTENQPLTRKILEEHAIKFGVTDAIIQSSYILNEMTE